MQKKIILSLLSLILVGGVTYKTLKIKEEKYQESAIEVVLSLEDKITKNSLWCGTFNLIWNDLKTEIIKKDIEFTPQLEIVENLNKGTFTSDQLKEESYYKVLGHPTYALKKQIEKDLKKKFQETSDILNNFEWTEKDSDDYFLYTMLKKEFSFEKEFTKLKKENFKTTKNVSYFGIEDSTSETVYENVQILYYKNEENFAISLKTKEKEEIILSRGINKESFLEIYKEIQQKSEKYKEKKSFLKGDSLKIPYLNLKIKKEFKELEHKDFYSQSGEGYYIDKALQTVSFELNERGGKIKSEAGMGIKNFSGHETSSRKMHFNDEFTLFFKEENKTLPYFATQITDIENFN